MFNRLLSIHGRFMMQQQEILCLKSVTLKYSDAIAVKNLDISVYSGEILGLLGPNGCGKSTTLNAIAGNHALESGCILLDGQSQTQQPLSYRAQIGFVPQELAFYEELSPYSNLSFFGRLYGIQGNKLSQRISEVLSLVKLDDRANMPAIGFSGGMKRRLNLACALMHKPKLLLLDEPTVGLDPPSREAVFSCLDQLRNEGCAIVYTTHYIEEVVRICNRVGFMAQGSMLFHGTLKEFQSHIFSKARGKAPNIRTPNYIYEEALEESHSEQSMLRKKQAEETYSLEQYLLELSEIKAA
jgi:ABC-2 type transport system ATP-binding protein